MKLTEKQKSYLPEAIAEYLQKESTRGSVNQEALEVGDKITITGLRETPASSVIDGVEREWIEFECTGDRGSISLATLVGGKTKHHQNIPQGRKLVRLSHNKAEAIIQVLNDYVGKTLEVVDIAEDVEVRGWSNTTDFVLFAEV